MAKYTYNPPYNQWSGNRSDTLNKWKINYKGSIATASALPDKGEFKGDTYNVLEDGSNYMWNGTSWDKLDANIYIGATSIKDGIQGLVPPASNSQVYSLLTGGGTWESAEALGLALDDEVVHLTGDETIEGVKTFQNTVSGHNAGDTVTDLVIRNPEVERGTPVEAGRSYTRVILADAEGDIEETFAGRLGLLEVVSPKENDTIGEELRLGCYKYSDNSVDYAKYAFLKVGYDTDEIPFSTAPATSDERTESTDIVTRGYMEASEWNWQKTKKAGAVTFKPVPESDLESVVDIMFTETPPASGEKGPENPSTITGVSTARLGVVGKNLFRSSQFPSTFTIGGGVTVTVDSDGNFTLNGTCNVSSLGQRQYVIRDEVLRYYYMPVGTIVTLSMQHISGTATATNTLSTTTAVAQIETKPKDSSTYGYNYVKEDSPKVTFGMNNRSVNGEMIVVAEGAVFTNYKFKIQLEISNAVTDFEPYSGQNYIISLDDTYYGGSLDVATGVMTVTEGKLTLNSSANFVSSSGFFFENANTYVCSLYPTNAPAYTSAYSIPSSYASNKLPVVYANNPSTPAIGLVVNSPVIRVSLAKSALGLGDGQSFATVSAAMKTWLGSNPIEFFYPLATPFTVQLTPTQIRSLPAIDKYEPRINTVYTDQEAVQVGYQRFFDENRLASIEARLEALEASQG